LSCGFTGDASSKIKVGKGKTDKKGGKDDKLSEKGKLAKEVIFTIAYRIVLCGNCCVIFAYLSTK